MSLPLPTSTSRPSTTASTPWPLTSRTSRTRSAVVVEPLSGRAPVVVESLSGCARFVSLSLSGRASVVRESR